MSYSNLSSGMYPVILYRLIRENSSEEYPAKPKDLIAAYSDYFSEHKEGSVQRTFYRNLESLQSFDGNIHVRMQDGSIDGNWMEHKKEIKEIFYQQVFELSDLRLMSDSIVFSRHLTRKSRKEILGKMETLYPHFHANNKYAHNDWYNEAVDGLDIYSSIEATDLYQNLDDLYEVIKEKQSIHFEVCFYNKQKELHPDFTVTGFSPYKICLQDGIYYLLGSLRVNNHRQERNEKNNFLQNIKRYPIHKIRKIAPDEINVFYEESKTTLRDKKIRELMESTFSSSDFLRYRQYIPHNIELFANDYGLQTILEYFSSKATVEKCVPGSCNYPLRITKTIHDKNEDSRIFYILLKNLNRQEWYHLITLLIQSPSENLVLLPTPELKEIIEHLSKYLNIRDNRNKKFIHT